MDQTVCLEEKDHAVGILHNLKEMQLEEDLCDFTIIVNENKIPSHKCVLSASSPYFKAMLRHETKESQEGEVIMQNVDFECVRSCIDFIYTGKFDIPNDKTSELLHVAVMMQLKRIIDAICNNLKKSLNSENYYSTFAIAKLYDLKGLSVICMAFYRQHFWVLSKMPEFLLESKSHLVEVFKAKNVISSEKEKLEAVLRWAEAETDRKEDVLELVELMNLREVSPEFLKNLLESNLTVTTNFHLYKCINAQLIETMYSLCKVQDKEITEGLLLFNDTTSCLQSYDLSSNRISRLPDSDYVCRFDFTAVCVEPHVYTLCPDKSVYRYNFNEEHPKWERGPDMMTDHGLKPPSVSVSGSLYVIGTGSGIGPCRNTEQFHPLVNEWIKLKNRPTPIAGAALVSYEESIYCIGGWRAKESNQSTSFCRFTPSMSEWVSLVPLRYARSYCAAVAVEGKLFVTGGFRGLSVTNMMECYNVTSKQWSMMSSLPKCLPNSLARAVNSSIYVIGCCRISDEILKYDVTKDEWSMIKLNGMYDARDFVVVPIRDVKEVSRQIFYVRTGWAALQ